LTAQISAKVFILNQVSGIQIWIPGCLLDCSQNANLVKSTMVTEVEKRSGIRIWDRLTTVPSVLPTGRPDHNKMEQSASIAASSDMKLRAFRHELKTHLFYC